MEILNNRKYYIGLDMGTSSIGWAVTYDNYRLVQKRKMYLWGVRLFDEAQSAEERRKFRRQRRTINKRNWRLHLLKQELRALVMKEDPEFFMKIKNSYLKSTKHTLFTDTNYNDIDYYREFPTIYHLRFALTNILKCNEYLKRNLYYRFLFLASHDILKTRGHFNHNGNLNFKNLKNIESVDEISKAIELINDEFDYELINKERFINLYNQYQKTREVNSRSKDKETLLLKLIMGNEVNITKLFDIENNEDIKISFASEWEEKVSRLNQIENVLHFLFEVYSSIRIKLFIKDSSTISEAKIKIYDKHKIELKKLKSDLKAIDSEMNTKYYEKMFLLPSNEKFVSYASYIGKIFKESKKQRIRKNSSLEDLIKQLKKIKEEYDKINSNHNLLEDINNADYLILPNNPDNRLIPYQIHLDELTNILNNFLNISKENSIVDSQSIYDHILTLLQFKVPYFVGPLSNSNSNGQSNFWLTKQKSMQDIKITPYNFNDVVDKMASNNAFIGKMLRKCTYLHNESCLPQETITYQKYIFYNTINKVKINDQFLNQKEKKILFEELIKFNKLNKKIITQKLGLDKDAEITGFGKDDDAPLQLSLNSVKTFREIFPNISNPLYEIFFDNVIKNIALIDKNEIELRKKIVNNMVDQYSFISIDKNQIDKLTRLSSNKWGNLSEKFLLGVRFVDSYGELKNLLTILEETNYNLMEIIYLKDEYGNNRNRDIIDKENDENPFPLNSDKLNRYLLSKYIPPQARRPIIQANLLIDEIVKIMGYPPEKIMIEFTRENQKNPKETKSRYKMLDDLYKKIKLGEYEVSLREKLNQYKENNDPLKSKKIYLYFLQLGKDIYSGEPIDFDTLISNSKMYDIDHIWPQSKIKDDSYNNLVLTKTQYNDQKSDRYPINADIQNQRNDFWMYLKKQGLMSSKKFERLTRKEPISDQELNDFVARQKTTLDWINISTAELFAKKFNKNLNDFIIFSKSQHVSSYRDEKNWLKVREINNFHHAHDAFLNIIVGNTLKVHLNAPLIQNNDDNNKIKKTYNILNILKYYISDDINQYAEKIFKYKDLLITKKPEIKNIGQYWDQNIVSPKEDKTNTSYFPIKKGLDVNMYGGYNKITTAFFTIIEKKGIKKIQAIPKIDCGQFYDSNEFNDEKFKLYIKEKYNSRIIENIIPINTKVLIDGIPQRISGVSKNNILYHNVTQLVIEKGYLRIIKNMLKYNDEIKKTKEKQKIFNKILSNGDYIELDIIFAYIFDYIIKNPYYSKNTKARFNPVKKLNIEDYFKTLTPEEKINTIYTIITKLTKANASNQGKLFGCTYGDFSKSSNITYKFSYIKESITGFYTKEIFINNV